jgi:hypothetical protein
LTAVEIRPVAEFAALAVKSTSVVPPVDRFVTMIDTPPFCVVRKSTGTTSEPPAAMVDPAVGNADEVNPFAKVAAVPEYVTLL